MALNLNDKKAIVSEVNEVASNSISAVVADSRGVSVTQMTTLRQKAREKGVYVRVVRNTLAKRAVEGTKYECLSKHLTGPSILGFSTDHPGAAARLFSDFAKENAKFELKVAAFEGALTDFSKLASLPTYDEAIAQLMMCMKEASAGKLARTIAAIRDQKQEVTL